VDKDKDVFYLKVNDIPGRRLHVRSELPPPVLSKSPGKPKNLQTDVGFFNER